VLLTVLQSYSTNATSVESKVIHYYLGNALPNMLEDCSFLTCPDITKPSYYVAEIYTSKRDYSTVAARWSLAGQPQPHNVSVALLTVLQTTQQTPKRVLPSFLHLTVLTYFVQKAFISSHFHLLLASLVHQVYGGEMTK
jgi:hypothetical protein